MQIPKNIQTDFLKETQSNVIPSIRKEGATVYYPVFIREVQDWDSTLDEPRTMYTYFDVPVKYIGQNLNDPEKFALQSYADIRRFFYGPVEAQLEQQLKGTFAAHQYAVRTAFPKSENERIAAVERFNTIKADFWKVVKQACALMGKSVNDLPSRFTAEDMLKFAADNGLPQEFIDDYMGKFSIISLNLLQNGRNWDELFGEE